VRSTKLADAAKISRCCGKSVPLAIGLGDEMRF
jgi:hypothetical protein